MEAEEDHNRNKAKGCGFLSFVCGRSPHNPSKKSIPKIDGKRETLTQPPPKEIPLQTSGHRRESSQENGSQLVVHKPTQPVLALGNGLSGELDMMIMDYQKAKGNSNLVRASSGNVMVNRQLGNIWGMNNARSTADGKALVLCRDLSEGMDPKKVKEMGNEEFRTGRLSAALALYGRAIMLDSSKAAVLARMSRLIEAITG